MAIPSDGGGGSSAEQFSVNPQTLPAFALYDTFLRQYPGDATVLLEYGKAAYLQQGHADLEKAANLFERAMQIDPQSLDAILWLADVAAIGYGPSYPGAIALYRHAIELNPNCVDAYIGLGIQRGAPSTSITLPASIDAFRRATQIDPIRIDAHNNLAMALLDAGQHDEARQEFAITVELLKQTNQPGMAQVIQSYIDKLDRHEPIKTRSYDNLSPRYDWLSQLT